VDDLAQLAESNINEDKTTIEMKETDLVGLSKEMISKLERVPGKEDYRIVPLSKQEVPVLMKLLQKDEARKKVDYEKGI
jgi:Zn-dependent oligopeptidase